MDKSKQIKQDFSKFWQQKGFRDDSGTIVPEHTDSVLFCNSGLSKYLDRSGYSPDTDYCYLQPCIKTNQTYLKKEAPKEDDYYIFFIQLAIIARFSPANMIHIISGAITFLTEVIKLNPDNIYVTIPTEQSEYPEVFMNNGILKQNISIDKDAPRININSNKNAVSGKYATISYFCNKKKLEIGDLGILDFGTHKIIDCGFGLERLIFASCQQRPEDKYLTTSNIDILGDIECARKFIDIARALSIINYHKVPPGNNGRKYIVRLLIKKLLSIKQYDQDICSLLNTIEKDTLKEYLSKNTETQHLTNYLERLILAEIKRTKKCSVLQNNSSL